MIMLGLFSLNSYTYWTDSIGILHCEKGNTDCILDDSCGTGHHETTRPLVASTLKLNLANRGLLPPCHSCV